ncbi:hypothetical protein ACH4HG_09460 [Streptomyces coeruleorubidus]|uniref:hypothetical protein n=1 Tax=Streptomyces coeruleorubidus TaxID=116188 RepID=UPI001875B5BB|nr:hypothetical protein [Streptomyces bellus]GGT81693.1 hypothetical protein GCM10010244_02470 [Streptomyces bellus]
MEAFVSVAVILGMIVLGVFLIHQLNSQHDDRIAAFHYGRSGLPVAGPAPSGRRRARGHGRFSWRRSREQAE